MNIHFLSSYRAFSAAICLLLLLGTTASPASEAFYQNRGVIGAARKIERAASGLRVLHTGAHPDDEDSALLAYLSLGEHARVWYLSLTRGEGGQNLIGPELSEDLGIIRTSELLAAREQDGAEQLFGRMIDFGFSKSADESLAHWGRDEVIKDIVRAIRMTRPHIVISRFSGTPRDGHGQHQAAGIGTREAIDAAADPERYPELGLAPWRVQKFYTQSFAESPDTTLKLDTSIYDPWIGRSLTAVGAKGRSQHRSQDMGMPEFETWRPSYLIRRLPPPSSAPETSVLDGLVIEPNPLRDRAKAILASPNILNEPHAVARKLAELLKDWRRRRPDDTAAIGDLESALANLLGIRLEAFADAPAVPIGGSVEVECVVYYPETTQLSDMKWSIESKEGLRAEPAEISPENPNQTDFKLIATHEAPPTVPYFLRSEPEGHLYEWNENRTAALPFEQPSAIAIFSAAFNSVPFELKVPVEHRRADPAFGEIRADLAVLPPVSVEFTPATRIVNLEDGSEAYNVEIQLENYLDRAFVDELVVFDSANPNQIAARLDVKLARGERARLNLQLTPEPGAPNHRQFMAKWSHQRGSAKHAYTLKRIDYRHIRPRLYSSLASLQVHEISVELPPDLKIGYVTGPGDDVGQVLTQLGADVQNLDARALASADLSQYDAIVLGVRAYEVRDDLKANNARLLDFARDGGTLVVQYNQYGYASGNYAPYPFNIRQPHDRVTDETAEVTLLDPDHPVFNFPNKITSEDFDNWIQERGLYFWSDWDERYTPLLASSDSGEEPKRGGLLYTKLGDGHFIYTGYAFFRQLPAGVEGSAQLFANLISLSRAP